VHFALLPLDTMRLPERHRNQLLVRQYDLERALEQRAIGLGATILRGHEIVAMRQDKRGVAGGLRAPDGELEVRSRFVVGCDGANSTVRQLAGVAFAPIAKEAELYGLVGDVEVAISDLPPQQQTGAHYQPSGSLYMAVPVGPDIMRLTTWEPCDQ